MSTMAWPAMCGSCGTGLSTRALRCASCGEFVHRARLERLSAEALARETADPVGAASIWQECLRLVPSDAEQAGMMRQRVALLASAAGAPIAPSMTAPPKDDPVPLALAKTVGSMIVSIVVYSALFRSGWEFATGIVLLILVHELGHVAAMRYYGLSASPPIFIPFVGAVINLRQPPRNALEEAVVGIGGPVAGTLAAAACYLWWRWHPGQETVLVLAHIGFLINLFNMLPVPPLDGGRVTAAVSPWIWMLGIVALVGWIALDLMTGGGIPWLMILLLMYAWPRVWATLKGRQRFHPYYAIGRGASFAVGAAYLILGLALIVLFGLTLVHGV